jgi:AcrR family transcriptional regulator
VLATRVQKSRETRRARLLAGFTDYLLQHGLADLSLRPVARALGTSPRMLLYYFGSKEELLMASIAAIRAREDACFLEEIQRGPADRPIADVILASWRWFTGASREPYLRLFYEIYGLAVARPAEFEGFVRAAGADYYAMMQTSLRLWGLEEHESRLTATRHLATFRGLMLDLLTTGDRDRIDATVAELARDLERELLAHRPELPPATHAGATAIVAHRAGDRRRRGGPRCGRQV